MATQNIIAIDVVKTISGNSPFTMAYPEAASQTFSRGAILTLDSAGRVIEATSPNPNRVLGVAAEDGHNVASVTALDVAHVWIADEDTVFAASLAATIASARTLVGAQAGLTKTGTNWVLDPTQTHASCRAIILGLDPRHALGDISALVHFRWIANFTLLEWTS